MTNVPFISLIFPNVKLCAMKLVTILDVFENEGLVLTRDQWNLVTTRDPKSISCNPQTSPSGLQ